MCKPLNRDRIIHESEVRKTQKLEEIMEVILSIDSLSHTHIHTRTQTHKLYLALALSRARALSLCMGMHLCHV